MAESGARNDPFVAFRFEVKIEGLTVGGFTDCTGLSLETEVQDYAEGGLNSHLHKFPGRTKQTNLTLKQGVVDRVLYDWYLDLVGGRFARKSGTILAYDPSGSTITMEWQFKRGFPCKWSGPELNASQSNVAVETVEICHEGLVREV